MTTITFDTHKFIKQLEVAGVPTVQAEAFVNAQRDILSEALDTSLATRSDMLALKSDLALMDTKFEAKFDKLSWMMGILIALTAANFAKQYF
jgi:Protein of unknown function (DUF1640)